MYVVVRNLCAEGFYIFNPYSKILIPLVLRNSGFGSDGVEVDVLRALCPQLKLLFNLLFSIILKDFLHI